MRLDDKSRLPLTLQDEDIGVKAVIDWSTDSQEFVLDINGEPFEGYVYIEPDFDPDSLKLKFITATATIN